MSKPWSPLKAALMTALAILVIGLVGGGVWAAVASPPDSEASGEKLGRALAPIMVLAAIAAYFVQRSKRNERK